MLFNSLQFVLFITVAMALFYALGWGWRGKMLLAAMIGGLREAVTPSVSVQSSKECMEVRLPWSQLRHVGYCPSLGKIEQ
jgi:hypothetical protein